MQKHSLLYKQTRNYHQVPTDHICVSCKNHKWWCAVHIDSFRMCDCDYKEEKKPTLKIDMKLPKDIKKYTIINRSLVWDSDRQTYRLMDI